MPPASEGWTESPSPRKYIWLTKPQRIPADKVKETWERFLRKSLHIEPPNAAKIVLRRRKDAKAQRFSPTATLSAQDEFSILCRADAMQAQCTEPVVIIGAGEFGTALYTELQAFNVDVRLFCLDPEKASPDGPFYLAEHEDILSWENLTERVASAVPELCPEDAAKCRYVLAIGASGASEEKYKSVVAAFQSAAGNTSKVQRDIHIRASSDPRHKRPGSFDVDEKGADAFIRSAFQTKDARWLGDDLFVAQRKVLKGLAENTLADTPILKDKGLQILSRNSNAEPVEGTTKLQQDETVHVVGSPAALDAVFRSADERRTREQRRGVIIPVFLFVQSTVLISTIFSLVGMGE